MFGRRGPIWDRYLERSRPCSGEFPLGAKQELELVAARMLSEGFVPELGGNQLLLLTELSKLRECQPKKQAAPWIRTVWLRAP